MKFLVLSLYASLAAATPIRVRAPADVIVPRDDSSTTRNDLDDGSSANCPKAILIFARGTTEAGNMGPIAGVPLAEALGAYYGDSNLWVQGVGGPYTAGLIENLEPGGTSQAAIGEGVRLFNEANTKCPNSIVVAGGYSQGAALMAGAISRLSATVRNQVKGTVLFGYTQDKQNNGGVPNYPGSELKVICAPGDLVCDGTLVITPAHLVYGLYAPEAAQFLESAIGPK